MFVFKVLKYSIGTNLLNSRQKEIDKNEVFGLGFGVFGF